MYLLSGYCHLFSNTEVFKIFCEIRLWGNASSNLLFYADNGKDPSSHTWLSLLNNAQRLTWPCLAVTVLLVAVWTYLHDDDDQHKTFTNICQSRSKNVYFFSRILVFIRRVVVKPGQFWNTPPEKTSCLMTFAQETSDGYFLVKIVDRRSLLIIVIRE